jgi:hypothetical protein
MITDPLYNEAGRAMGIDTAREWSVYYDKIREIVEWAKLKSGFKDKDRLVNWIYGRVQTAAAISKRKIDDLYILTKLNK